MKVLALSVACALATAGLAAAPRPFDQDKSKPQISIKANPTMAFSPARIVFTVNLKGGSNDYQDFYCPTTEWEWGDGTTSHEEADCDPYAAGKSQIKRTFATEHTFNTVGEYQVVFRLKQKDKVVGAGSARVQVRCGLGDQDPRCGL